MSLLDRFIYFVTILVATILFANCSDAASTPPGFIWPLNGRVIEIFGPQDNGKNNDALRISVENYSEVKAAAKGEIVYTGNEIGSYGNLIIIQHANNWFSSYGHLDEIKLKKGDFVERGEVIGYINGKDSNDFGLYFGLREGETPVNPMIFMPKWKKP